MYLKLTIFSMLFLSAFMLGEAKNEPNIHYKKISYQSLQNHPCKDFSLFLESFGKHPLVLAQLENFPKEKVLTLYINRPLMRVGGQELVKLYDFLGSKLVEDNIFIPTCIFLPGERIEITIKSQDGDFVYKTNVIPNTIRGKNKQGDVLLTAELKLFGEGMDSYLLSLVGFSDNEEVLFKSISGKEVIEHPMVCSKNHAFMVSPAVKFQKGGVGKVSITRKSGEVISVNLPWGDELLKYSKGEFVFDPED